MILKIKVTHKAAFDAQGGTVATAERMPRTGSEESLTSIDTGPNVNIVFEIHDNGIGIDPEKQFLLFKPFSQVPTPKPLSRQIHILALNLRPPTSGP